MKKYLPYILIITAVAVGVLSPAVARAENWMGVPTVGDLVRGLFAEIGNLILGAMSWLVWAAAGIFNYAVSISLDNQTIAKTGIVQDGWTVARDLANLFFIFILLYIAIATILQLSNYGMKQLLGKIIIVALLVNFSLLITGVIIDSSNILALEFYNKIGAQIDDRVSKASATVPAKDIAAAFVGGLKIQTVYDTEKDAASKFGVGGKEVTLTNIFIITIFGSILFLVTAFVLFAAAILFVIRTVILWILMMLAPLAFLAMVLPATKGYASQWWKKLFEQAFFAPVFMFLFYLVAKLINSDGLSGIIGQSQTGFGGIIWSNGENVNVNLIMQFIILIMLMISCLIIAKQMGAAGATTMQSWGQSAKKWGQGYAGRISKRYTAPVADRLASGTEKTKFGRVVGSGLRKVPLMTKGLAKAGTWDKPEIKKYEKQYSSYSPAARANINASPRLNLLNRAQKQAIENIEKKRKEKDAQDKILETGTSIDKVKILAKREKEAREEIESELKAEKAAPKPKETTEKT